MDLFVARQPILDRDLHTFGYELLFRSGAANHYNGSDADAATAAVLSNTFLSIGAEKILGDRKGFVNLPRQMLTGQLVDVLPHETVIIEILEDIVPDAEVVEACRNLKRAGYLLALDDFVRTPDIDRLIDLADFIKVDFRATPQAQRLALAAEFGAAGIRMLAEKVETRAEYEEACAAGYSYFQGYFFAKPQVMTSSEVPATKINHLRVLRELQRTDLDLKRLEELISHDLSLAPKVLRYVNSAAFAFNQRVGSIMQALILLGDHHTRKLITLAVMAGFVSDRPPELVWAAFTRARLCETTARQSGRAHLESDCFLMGLFSLLDAMVGRPAGDLFEELGMPVEITGAVTGLPSKSNVFSAIYNLCLACESGDMPQVENYTAQLKMPIDALSALNIEAITWAELLCRESGIEH